MIQIQELINHYASGIADNRRIIMFAKDKVSQSMIDAVNKVLSEDTVDEASVKVPTKTGTMVYGGAKGGSGKAYLQQKYGDDLADVHGPSDKDLEAIKHEKKKKKEVDEEVEGLDEMDKGGYRATRDDDDNDYTKGKWIKAKPMLAKDATSSAFKQLNKAFNKDSEKKDMKKEEVESLDEVLSKDADAAAWIHDFVHSDNPKFKGKSTKERQQMALGAYYAKQRNEEVEEVQEGLMKKIGSILGKKEKSTNLFDQPDVKKDTKDYLKKSAKQPDGPNTVKNIFSKEENTSFAYRLLQSIREGKGNQPQETFTDNNIGEAGVDPSIKTTDTLAGRKPGGKLNQHGPDPKIKLKSEEKEEDEGHEDEKEDKKLIKKMVKSDCVKEEDVTEAMDTRADVPAFLRKQRGDKPLTPDEVKAKKPDTRSAPGNVKEAEEKEPPFAGPYTKTKGKDPRSVVTNLAGKGIQGTAERDAPFAGGRYKKTPTSNPAELVKKLASKAHGRIKETLMGKISNEEVEELDELKDKTVASYISKRMTGVMSKEYQRGKGDQEAKSRTGGFNPFDAKGYKEKEGLKRAASRLAKEEVEDLEEDAMLDVYLKSRGLNPANIPTDKKIAYAKGSDFLRWKQNHS